MPTPVRELLHLVSPFSFSVQGEGDGEPIDTLVIKGFASVERPDRSGDRTDPEEFNVAEFMAAPTLLVNHKFWKDPMGNDVAVGRPLSVNSARLADIGSDDVWGVIDLKTREQINTFPKEKVPALKKGDKGLFVTAEVTQTEVREQIARGELSGMSWRGLVEVGYEVVSGTNETRRVLKNIDLFEISVVHVPANNQATFVVGKMTESGFEEIDMEITDSQLYKVQLPKSHFASKGMVSEYLQTHKLSVSEIYEDDYSYFAVQTATQQLDLSKTVRVRMGESFMLMAPPIISSEPVVSGSLVAELVGNLTTISKAEEDSMSAATDVKPDDEQVIDTKDQATEDQEKKAKTPDMEDKEKKEKSEEAVEPTKTDAEKQLEVLGSHVAKSVADVLTPTLEKMTEGLASFGTTLNTMVEKMAPVAIEDTDTDTEAKTKTDAEPQAEEVLKGIVTQLSELAEQNKKREDELVEVAKSAVALGKALPNPGEVREEKVETQKSTDSDVNSCFDGSFPFLK